jgi:hypothetical protein
MSCVTKKIWEEPTDLMDNAVDVLFSSSKEEEGNEQDVPYSTCLKVEIGQQVL